MMNEILKRLRKERHLTQTQLAEHLNLSQATIASWENGSRRPDLDYLPTIAEFYGVSVDLLLGRDETSKPTVATTDEDFDWNAAFADPEYETLHIMARGMKKMSPENRQKILDVAQRLFAEDFDAEGNRRK